MRGAPGSGQIDIDVGSPLSQRILELRERALQLTRWFITDEVRALGEIATTRALLLVLVSPLAILSKAHEQEIDLVILDRTMPGRDGPELLAAMRRCRPELPAIISSGYADSPGAEKLSVLGIDGILQKPWSPSELVHLVGELGLVASRVGGTTQTPQAS